MVKCIQKGGAQMVSKEMKSFCIENENYRFDNVTFNTYFKNYAKYTKINIGILEEMVATKLFVSQSAVHNWRFGSNGPGTIDLIRNLASAISISNTG